MALIKCPHCAGTLSTKALSCPHCAAVPPQQTDKERLNELANELGSMSAAIAVAEETDSKATPEKNDCPSGMSAKEVTSRLLMIAMLLLGSYVWFVHGRNKGLITMGLFATGFHIWDLYAGSKASAAPSQSTADKSTIFGGSFADRIMNLVCVLITLGLVAFAIYALFI